MPRAGKEIEDDNRFGTVAGVVGGSVSPAGGSRVPLQLMLSLLYPKRCFDESDEGVGEGRIETPNWQYLSSQDSFDTAGPVIRR